MRRMWQMYATALLTALFVHVERSAAQHQEVLWVKVIFYDFHADGSNPEFQMTNSYDHETGMVLPNRMEYDQLNADYFEMDSIGKPIHNPGNTRHNYYMKYWFRPWEEAARGDYTVPNYVGASGRLASPPTVTVDHDTSFKNVVIKDSLPFVHVGDGVYQFSRPGGSNQFFWLDNRGFGHDNRRTDHNYSFTMELHREFTFKPGLRFDFQGDDDVWVYIDGKLALDIGGVHLPVSGSFVLNDAFAQRFGLVENEEYTLSVFYCERHTVKSTIQITTNLITSVPDSLALQVSGDTIQAGDTASIWAYIRDQNDSLRQDLANEVQWSIDPATREDGDILLNAVGQSSRFTGTVAYRPVRINASYYDPKSSRTLTSIATIYIDHGPPSQVVIERVSDTPLAWETMQGDISLNRATPLDRIIFGPSQTKQYAYAVTRDAYGNFVDRASTAIWSSAHPDMLTAQGTPSKQWQGDLTRLAGAQGETSVTASVAGLTPGVVPITITNAVITDLRLVDATNPSEPLASIDIHTGQTMTVKVQGIYSDNPGVWTDVTGTWSLAGQPLAVQSAIPLPQGQAGSWTISPINPGNDTIAVISADNNASVSVPLNVSRENPTTARMKILTPPEQRIAGQPIQIEVLVENSDGPVPGTWCGSSIFDDVLKDPASPWQPFVVIDGDTVALAAAGQQCFENGYDTVQTTLFFAPREDLHMISVSINDSLSAVTEKFKLYPGPLAELRLEYPDSTRVPDQLTMRYPDDSKTFISMGYDAYGNQIEQVLSAWTTTQTLHAPTSDSVPQIYYDANSVVDSEKGDLVAAALSNPAISDAVFITIIGPNAQLTEAITRDFSGDGYLDAFELRFNKPDALPADISGIALDINHKGNSFTVTDIQPVAGQNPDSVLAFNVSVEQIEQGIPQTDWRPLVTLQGVDGVEDAVNVECTDGAGPVIWSVVKTVNDASARQKDLVQISFSEDVLRSDGSPLTASIQPAAMFNVWLDGTVDSAMFAGISTLARWGDDYVEFYMTNGRSLETSHKVNIRIDPSIIGDDNGVQPIANNRQAPVTIRGDLGDMIVGPNPATPTSEHDQTTLKTHGREVFDWVRNGKGVVMEVAVVLSNDSLNADLNRIAGQLLIFDAVGNLVYSRQSDDVLRDESGQPIVKATGDSSNIKLRFYWNGTTNDKRKSAPGLYRAILYLEQFLNETRLSLNKYMGNIGIKR